MNIVGVSLSWIVLVGVLAGCSLQASLEDLNPSVQAPPIKHDKDFSGTEVVRSGVYSVSGQIADISEKKVSGSYTFEGVIAYE